jgi:hypothetical protein
MRRGGLEIRSAVGGKMRDASGIGGGELRLAAVHDRARSSGGRPHPRAEVGYVLVGIDDVCLERQGRHRVVANIVERDPSTAVQVRPTDIGPHHSTYQASLTAHPPIDLLPTSSNRNVSSRPGVRGRRCVGGSMSHSTSGFVGKCRAKSERARGAPSSSKARPRLSAAAGPPKARCVGKTARPARAAPFSTRQIDPSRKPPRKACSAVQRRCWPQCFGLRSWKPDLAPIELAALALSKLLHPPF